MPAPTNRTTAALIAVALAMLLGWTASAAATPSSDAVAAVNALRAKVGVRAIANDEALAGDCAAHAAWMDASRTASHGEPAGSTLYSDAGDDAGRHSVLHLHTGLAPITSIETIPWLAQAPLHVAQLLHPGLVRSGYAISGDAACMWTLDPTRRSVDVFDPTRGRGTFHTWPNARTGPVAPSQDTSSETPNPNETVGLPRAQVTGPVVLVFASGFGNRDACGAVRFVDVRLVGSDGSRPRLRWWDDARTIARDRLAANQCPVPAGGGWFLAERPLRQGTSYTATIRLVGAHATKGTKPVVRTVELRTSGPDRVRPGVRVTSMVARHLRGGRYSWRLVATVADASPTTCTATVQAQAAPCRVRARRIVLAGVRQGHPRSVRVALVVRDAPGNVRRVSTSRRAG